MRLRDAILHRSGFQDRRVHHPDPTIRRKAIDMTNHGIDSLRAVGRRILTLWLCQDGFDYAFPQQPHFLSGKIRVIIAVATPARGPGHSEPSTVSWPKSRSLSRCCAMAAKLVKRERWPQVTPRCRPRQILHLTPEKVIDPR